MSTYEVIRQRGWPGHLMEAIRLAAPGDVIVTADGLMRDLAELNARKAGKTGLVIRARERRNP